MHPTRQAAEPDPEVPADRHADRSHGSPVTRLADHLPIRRVDRRAGRSSNLADDTDLFVRRRDVRRRPRTRRSTDLLRLRTVIRIDRVGWHRRISPTDADAGGSDLGPTRSQQRDRRRELRRPRRAVKQFIERSGPSDDCPSVVSGAALARVRGHDDS